MAGDFNLRHPMWDPRETQGSGARASDLIALAEMDLNLTIESDPKNIPTWSSNRTDQRDGVLDLIWLSPAVSTAEPVQVQRWKAVNSDHAPVAVTLNLKVEKSVHYTVKRGSENGAKFVRAVRERLNAGLPNNMDEYVSADDVEQKGQWIQ